MKNVKRLQTGKSSEEFTSLMLKFAFFFFEVGLLADLLVYVKHDASLLAWINAASMALSAFFLTLHMTHKMKAISSLLVVLWIAVINLCITIIYMSNFPGSEGIISIALAMAISVIPVLLAQIVHKRLTSFIFGLACMGCYIVAAIRMNEGTMLEAISIYILIFLGTATAQWVATEAFLRGERERAAAEKEKDELARFMAIDPETISLLRQGKLDKKEIDSLMSGLTDKVRNQMLRHARTMVYDKDEMTAAFKKCHAGLTTGELELCCMIVEGRSVMEISELRRVSTSTVTSMRSRLRTKVALPDGESLRSYLQSIVHSTR